MDWKDVGKIVAPLAPTLGGILGDLIPIPGGGMIGTAAGNIIAAALGVDPTPDAVGAAIQNDPNAVAKISAAETEAAAKWPALAEIAKAKYASNAAQSESINQTIRNEATAKVSWWHWRHLLGYLVLLYGIEQVAAIAYTMFGKGVPPDQLATLFNSTAIFTAGLFALLGYVAQDTTALKQTAMTGQAPDGVIASTIKAVTGKKK
jgi:hypothetical protein